MPVDPPAPADDSECKPQPPIWLKCFRADMLVYAAQVAYWHDLEDLAEMLEEEIRLRIRHKDPHFRPPAPWD